MPTRDTVWPTGVPCWIDVMTTDVAGAKAFYGDLFGWTFDDRGADFAGYHIVSSGGLDVAGLSPMMQEGAPVVWTTYFATDDIERSVERIMQGGGKIMAEPMEIPGQGQMAIAIDPQGAVFGLWQGSTRTGTQRFNEPNTPVWNDLHTTDPAQAAQFYAQVFGVEVNQSEMPGAAGYLTLAVEGEGRCGVTSLGDMPPGCPSHWLAWVMVDDVDATVAAAQQRGARVPTPPFDAAWGRSAIITDPWGASLAVLAPTTG